MGFVGLDKGKNEGAGTVVLDLLIKVGMMREVDFGKWLCEQGYHQNTIFGDRKSIKLYAVFKNNIRKRGHSLSEVSIQLDEFEKVLATVQTLPK